MDTTKYTMTTMYLELIPYLESLDKISVLTTEDKKDKAINFIVEMLNKARSINNDEDATISRAEIVKTRNIMIHKENISQIIYYLNCLTKSNT